MSFGVPIPTVKTLPVFPALSTACATPGPAVEQTPRNPLRSGWAFIRSVAICVAFATSSPRYTVSTSCASGYFSFEYFLISAIHWFSCAAVSPQDTTANFPLPPMAFIKASVSA